MPQQLATLHKMLLDTVRHVPVCRRLMTAPARRPVVALTYRASIDQPQCFVHSRAVGAHVGLTPRRHQSGELDHDGGISKSGDTMTRTMLFEAAQILMTQSRHGSWLNAWGMKVAQRRGMRRAIVAVARRLAVVLHRMGQTAPTSAGAASRAPRSLSPDKISNRSFTILPWQEESLTGTKVVRDRNGRSPVASGKGVQKIDPRRFILPIVGRPRADPGEKHEPRVAISSSAEPALHVVACQSFTTAAPVAAENGLRLLTQAAIEKRPFN